jgi:acetolactate synthase-1/2/3 large subunit
MAIDRLFSSPVTAAKGIGKVLEEAGIEFVFGIAGGHSGHIWAALADYQDSIRTVLVREESLGSAMAEVYGRLTRRPGVLVGQGPWVLGNGLLGTIEAHLSSSPLLLLTDFSDTPELSLHGPYQTGTGDYGGWDARLSFRGVTKQVMEAHHPAGAVHATQLALKHALSGQPGPVAVLFSISAFQGALQPDAVPHIYPTQVYLPKPSSALDAQALAEAAAVLRDARKPVLIAGNGVRIGQAFAELQALAEGLGIPVVTSPSGKGCFAETNDLALGLFGTFGTQAANACVADADVVLVVGCKLTASDTIREHETLLDPRRQTFIQVDIEPRNASWTFPAQHVLIGEASVAMRRLLEEGGASAERRQRGLERVAAYRRAHGHFDGPAFANDAVPMVPQRLIREMQNALPDDCIVTCDAGENRIFMMHFYQVKQAGGFLQAAGAGPMGYAIPAALAAKLVHPDRTVVAVCGDGGFSMTMNGLMTAVENDIPIIVVIFNNHMLGWSTHIRGPFGATFHDFDHARLAESLECHGIKARTPQEFREALRHAATLKRPSVIDVEISSELTYKDVMSKLMQ